MRLFRTNVDSFTTAMARRLRTILGGHRLPLLAEEFGLPAAPLGDLLEGNGGTEIGFLLDVVAASVHRWGIDPEWLLSGAYDGALHREALSLGADRSVDGVTAVRELVEREYRRLHSSRILSLPSFRDIMPRRAAG